MPSEWIYWWWWCQFVVEEIKGRETQLVYFVLDALNLCMQVLDCGLQLQDSAVNNVNFSRFVTRTRLEKLDDVSLQSNE